MSSTLIIGLELALVFGIVLAIAVFELLSLRRDGKRPKPRDIARRD